MIKRLRFPRLFFVIGMLICMRFVGHAADIDKSGISDQIISFQTDSVLSKYFAPIKGKVISPFGYRGRRLHTGTDIKLQHGDTVRAAFDGLVTKACPYSGYGNLVIIKHPNNIETYYSHLCKCIVQNGDSVKAGQVVGLGGRTGRATTDHLHFELRFNHVAKNAEKYFDFKNCEVKEVMKDKLATEAPMVDNVVFIRKGDTLYSLSKRFNTTVKQLQELNSMEGTNLRIGMSLKVK
ncbi:MAG TPA: peptidoglycan DD-metalloendopeptidase family protein [Bacteroidales bacterium]|nr:peptidoglycan DD-metalloendopeptidase family protein [Bacteroidales bacterium]